MKFKLFKILPCAVALLCLLSGRADASPISKYGQPISPNTSLNWAGYVSTAGKFTGISGSWIVPDVRNNKRVKSDSAWIGIGGVNSNDLIQTGTAAITGQQGQVVYQAWYELLPDYAIVVPLQVNSGDKINASVAKLAGNTWKITLKNLNTGAAYQRTVQYQSSLSSAEWIEEMPSTGNDNLIALDNFKSVLFSRGFTNRNGKKTDIAKSGAMSVSMVNAKGRTLAYPSTLDKDGASFEVRRK